MQDFVSEFLYGIQAYMIKSVLGDHKVEVVDSIVVVKGTWRQPRINRMRSKVQESFATSHNTISNIAVFISLIGFSEVYLCDTHFSPCMTLLVALQK